MCLGAPVIAVVACQPGQAQQVSPPTATRSEPGPPGAQPTGVVPSTPPPVAVTEMLGEITPARLQGDVEALASFGTRHTLSEVDGADRGIGAARRFIAKQLQAASPRLQVELDTHRVEPDGRRIDRPVDVVNVVAVLPGSMSEAAGRRYYVIGHYDSRASDPMDATSDAPGANDDGSGTALVIEVARVLSTRELDATVVFMATAGEEQGLIGADRHARAAQEKGLDVRAVLSNDIVGDPSAPDGSEHRERVRVFSAGLDPWLDEAGLDRIRTLGSASDSSSRQLARFVDTVARWHGTDVQPMLIFRRDRFLRGGDHTAFNASGFAAVRFTEVAESYHRQHQDVRTEEGVSYGDLPRWVDPDYLAGVAGLNAATLMHLANAPAPPEEARLIAAELTTDTTLRWSRGPEPDLAGYEVVWRATTAPQWEHVRDVGDATTATLPLSKDDWFFGVRAYDEDGYRSPVSYPTVARQ